MTATRPAPLRAGIIAAGFGERLRGGGTLKPLVPIGGRPLIDRVLASIAETGAAEVVVIVNEESTAVQRHVAETAWPFHLRWIVETTPSSMHSFLRVVETLAADGDPGPFLISTVDTVTSPGAFARFVAQASAERDAAITLALTDVVDDEAPLLVKLAGRRVAAIGEDAGDDAPWATAGYYLVRPSILAAADAARRDGLARLRAFLARLVERGYRVDGVPVLESIDVDRPLDVDAAEALIRRVTR